jgi:hypothetical protein
MDLSLVDRGPRIIRLYDLGTRWSVHHERPLESQANPGLTSLDSRPTIQVRKDREVIREHRGALACHG